MVAASRKSTRWLQVIGPGILVAATGVGAGDLAMGALSGNVLGVTVLWAVVLGALLKFVLTEGLTRWQLVTGETLLEGCVARFGRLVQWIFLVYLLVWSFLVGMALMSAVGVTGHAVLPLFGSEAIEANKIFYGAAHSLVAVLLVKIGGFRVFERVMSVCIGVMFVVVVATAIALQPPLLAVVQGLLVPRLPPDFAGITWAIALMGGVGGTVTILCYGYWIREEGRRDVGDLRLCRIDLASGYLMTGLFGICMVIISSQMPPLSGRGAQLVVNLANHLEETLGAAGPVARWAFLAGAWGAVFSSLLGVWQSIPYLFTDFWQMTRGDAKREVNTNSRPYNIYLAALATLPVIGLVLVDFRTAQKVYAVFGALFIPLVAAVLLVLNGRATWLGQRYRNSWLTTALLAATLIFFLGFLGLQVRKVLSPPPPPNTSSAAPWPWCESAPVARRPA